MKREKFSEKIPFRLTRMLVNAMEVTGIEGTYRRNCESVMTVLHKNKDSLMAVLEAFVYDPLLNWRLMDNTAAKCKCSDTQGLSSVKEIGKLLGSLASNFPEKVVSSSVEGCVEEGRVFFLVQRRVFWFVWMKRKISFNCIAFFHFFLTC